MSIDSENKRRSCMSHKLPGLGIRPRPDGSIGQSDRRHSALYYAGIDAQYIPTTFWVPVQDSVSSQWAVQTQSASNWKMGSSVSTQWVNQQETEDE